MSKLLQIEELVKAYGKGQKPALDHISFTVGSGRIVGLLGPNGSGKTTLIKLINGLLTPTSGKVLICGEQPGVASKAIISYLPDRLSLPGDQTIGECIAYYRDFYKDFDTERAEQMLSSLQIDRKKRIKALSKGTREKVQLILVMSRRAKLYILDEPIAGVDPAARDYIIRTIIGNYDKEASILLSTHLISDVENILDDVILIQDGAIRLSSSVEDLREEKGKSLDAIFREVFAC